MKKIWWLLAGILAGSGGAIVTRFHSGWGAFIIVWSIVAVFGGLLLKDDKKP